MPERTSVFWRVMGNALYLVAVVALLLLMASYNIVLFHTTVEVFSMVVAAAVIIVAFNGRQLLDNDYLLFVGISFFSFALLDLPHMLAFPGIAIFGTHGLNYASQIYIVQRLVLAASFVIAPAFLTRRLRPFIALGAYIAMTAALLALVFTDRFPVTYQPGFGLTPFKIGAEALISAMFLVSILALYVNRDHFDRRVLWMLISANAFFVVSEVFLSAFRSEHDPLLLAGHLAQGMALYLTYKAVVETAFVRPSTLLYKQLADRERAISMSEERYREVADTLQTALLDVPDEVGDVSVVHRYESSSETARIGGDFYDVFGLSEDLVGFVLGDVSGKGLPAATTMAEVKSTVRAYAYLQPNPRFVLEHTNMVLCRMLADTQFVTAVFGTLDSRTGALDVASAGHEEPVLCLAERCELLQLPTNVPLGVDCESRFEPVRFRLVGGEGLVLYTDGIPDARKGVEMFGRERVRELVERLGPQGPRQVAQRMVEEALEFTGGHLSDDVAVLGLQLNSRSGGVDTAGAAGSRAGEHAAGAQT